MKRLLAALLLCSSLPAAAQVAEISVGLRASQFTGKDLGEIGIVPQPLELDDGYGVVARLDVAAGRFFGHQLNYGYDREDLTLSNQELGAVEIHQFFYDFVFHALPRGSRIRPFVEAGVGFSTFFPPGEQLPQAAGVTKFGFNYGGGIKFRLTRLFGIRFDVRDHITNKPDFLDLGNLSGRLHHIEYSGGLSLLF